MDTSLVNNSQSPRQSIPSPWSSTKRGQELIQKTELVDESTLVKEEDEEESPLKKENTSRKLTEFEKYVIGRSKSQQQKNGGKKKVLRLNTVPEKSQDTSQDNWTDRALRNHKYKPYHKGLKLMVKKKTGTIQ